MNGNGREKARVGGAGQARDRAGIHPLSASMILQPTEFVNPLTIPTAAAGVVNWTVCDSLHTLARELVKRGLVVDNDELTAAIGASWATMMNEASYIPAAELAEIERALEVGQ